MGFFSATYNPCDEPTNRDQVVAARWELLRRNAVFQSIAQQWIESRDFRVAHAATEAYHDKKTHYPRCALDWMLTPSERMEILQAQMARGRIFVDARFNFGPVICKRVVSSLEFGLRKGRDCFHVRPFRWHAPLRLEDNWQDVPKPFKMQFRLAVTGDAEFEEFGKKFHDLGTFFRWAAPRIVSETDKARLRGIAEQLSELGNWFHEAAEFHKIFALPTAIYTPAGLREQSQRVRASFEKDELFDTYARYNRRGSYLGTKEEWFWFLTAEHERLDWRTSTGAYKLAERYSQRLKQKGIRRRSDARLHGHTGQSVPSKVVRDRRKTVQKHCRELQGWIDKTYPPVA